MTKRYVLGEVEVELTGKTAKRAGSSRPTRRNPNPVADIKYEIRPANKENGDWVKWVRIRDLYEIVEGDIDDDK